MRIPDASGFGQVLQQPQQAVLPHADTQEQQAWTQLGQFAGEVGIKRIADQTRWDNEERDKALSNQALDAALDHELRAKSAGSDFLRRVQAGEIGLDEAPAKWTEELSRIESDTVGKLPSSQFAPGAVRHARSVSGAMTDRVTEGLQSLRRDRYGADAVGTLDRLGKIAALPDQSVDDVFAKADQLYLPLAQRAGVHETQAAKVLQDWKDGVRYQRARLDLVNSRRDEASLDAFMKRVESGDLSGKLDPDKRVALVKEAESMRWQLQQATQHAVDKREKVAERAIAATTRQIEAGVPVALDGWEELRSKVDGTPYASDFNALVTQEREVQKVLRLPLDQQETYVQQREADLMKTGGTMVDKANLGRIKNTVEQNRKQLQDAPLVASQRLFGHSTVPIDWADMVQPGGAARAAEAFNDRAATLQAMRKQFGATVGFKPLLPQEVGLLGKVLDEASPSAAVALFGAMRNAIGSDDVYSAAMAQIAPDSPVKAHAGLLAALNIGVTTERNLIADDRVVSSAKVAQTMLAGEAILNKTKAQKAQDGKEASLAAPSRASFETAFADHVGDLYRGRNDAQQADLQSAWAYYVGRAAEIGRLASDAKDVDPKIVREAIGAVIGDVVNVNGQGKAKAPLGMRGGDFQQKAKEAFSQEIRSRGLPASMLDQWPHFGLQNYAQDGTYVLTLGGLPVVDPKTRQPVILDLIFRGRTGRKFGRTPGEIIPTENAPLPAAGGQQ